MASIETTSPIGDLSKKCKSLKIAGPGKQFS